MTDDPYNAFITRVEPGESRPGRLSGRTLAVKDLFDTAGVRTTYGSNLYADHVPERNATTVQRLLDAGAVLVGKTHLPEFAWGVLGQSEWYGTCHNPTHPGKTTGGSSSGSAAALAAGLCELALGSDTGCSIRLPSAACEVVGLKSQWGLIPTDGVFPLVPTLDTVGPMAGSVEDVALMWSVLTDRPVPEPRLARFTVGLLRQPPGIGDGRETERSDAAEAWVADLQRLGAHVVEARVPDATANTWPQFQHEALQSHAATFPSRADEYGELMQKKLRAAQRATPDEIEAAYRAIERVASVRARGRPLRQSLLRDRAAARGRRRARGAAAAHVVPALDESHGLGRAGHREHAARRPDRRGRARGGARVGARVGRTRGCR